MISIGHSQHVVLMPSICTADYYAWKVE